MSPSPVTRSRWSPLPRANRLASADPSATRLSVALQTVRRGSLAAYRMKTTRVGLGARETICCLSREHVLRTRPMKRPANNACPRAQALLATNFFVIESRLALVNPGAKVIFRRAAFKRLETAWQFRTSLWLGTACAHQRRLRRHRLRLRSASQHGASVTVTDLQPLSAEWVRPEPASSRST